MRRTIIVAAALLSNLIFAGTGRAQNFEEFRFYEENDVISPFGDRTDRYYTQGLKGEFLWAAPDLEARFLPGIAHGDWCSLLCGRTLGERIIHSGFAVGQNMYTPEVITIAEPQPSDRPWAGYLYASRIARIRYEDEQLKAQRQDTLEVTLGVVGPASLAGPVQIGWHHLIGVDRPEGWDNQLKNEPVLQLRYEAALRWPKKDGGNADVIPRVRVNLGNALTSLEAEVMGRLGWNLSGFGVTAIPAPPPPAPPPALAAMRAQASTASQPGKLRANLFVRAGIKAIAHNITIDGNTFASNDIRIRRRPLVPEIAAGVEVGLSRHWSLSYQFVRRGSEFETRSGHRAPAQEFGAITIAWTSGK